MPVIDPRYAAVIAQAETLCVQQREAYAALIAEREAQQAAWLVAQTARFKFLQQHDAAPMDVADYDAWLAAFVTAGGELTHYVEGSFPRIRLMGADITHLFIDGEVQAPQAETSLADAYYTEPVIWTIDQPVDLADIPALHGDQALTLHLTQRALKNFTSQQLQAAVDAGVLGENEFYLDGAWVTVAGAPVWSPQADVVQAIPYVWDENVRNMMGKRVLL